MIGWLGSILLSICGLPQAIQCVKQKHADGVNWCFLGFWGSGEVFTLWYILSKESLDFPLILNYGLNIIFISIIVYYKFKNYLDTSC